MARRPPTALPALPPVPRILSSDGATGRAKAYLRTRFGRPYRIAHRIYRALYLGAVTLGGGDLRTAFGQVLSLVVLSGRPRLGRLRQHAPGPVRWPLPVPIDESPTWPSISIVTPCRDAGRWLERTLASVLDQGYPRLEYRVQDGASGDGTAAILARHGDRLSGIESRPDRGQAEAINRAFERTSGEVMAWLNADDLLLPGALASVGRFFARHPEVDAVYGHRILIDEDDLEIGRWVLPAHDDEALRLADFVPQETLFWRRRLWERTGARVREDFRFALDWELLLRFQAAGARFVRLPRFLGAFRVHDEQKTSAAMAEHGRPEMDRLRERLHGRPLDDDEIFAGLVWYYARHLVLDRALGHWSAR